MAVLTKEPHRLRESALECAKRPFVMHSMLTVAYEFSKESSVTLTFPTGAQRAMHPPHVRSVQCKGVTESASVHLIIWSKGRSPQSMQAGSGWYLSLHRRIWSVVLWSDHYVRTFWQHVYRHPGHERRRPRLY